MNIRPALVLLKDQKILTMRYRYGERDVFNLPGGNVDFGEGMKETLERELMEELGLKVEVGDLLFVGEVHRQERQTLHCVFRGEILEGEPALNPRETSALDVYWLDPEELGGVNLYPNVSEALGKEISGHTSGWFLGKIEQHWY